MLLYMALGKIRIIIHGSSIYIFNGFLSTIQKPKPVSSKSNILIIGLVTTLEVILQPDDLPVCFHNRDKPGKILPGSNIPITGQSLQAHSHLFSIYH